MLTSTTGLVMTPLRAREQQDALLAFLALAVDWVAVTYRKQTLSGRMHACTRSGLLTFRPDPGSPQIETPGVGRAHVRVDYDVDAEPAWFETRLSAVSSDGRWWMERPSAVVSSSRRLVERHHSVPSDRCVFTLEDDGQHGLNTTHPVADLSTGGMGLLYHPLLTRIEAGQYLEGELELPTGETFHVHAAVVSCSRASSGSMRRKAGIRFIGMPLSARLQLSQALCTWRRHLLRDGAPHLEMPEAK